MEEKVVVYCVTREVYDQTYAAVNSLLTNNKIDRVIIICEDEKIPFMDDLPVDYIMIDGLKEYFSNSINAHTNFTYMSFARLLLPEILPYDKILYLDVDTIVDKNIEELWDIDLDSYYVAAVRDVQSDRLNKDYFNSGVLLMNLKKLKDGTMATVLELLFTKEFLFPDQDALNMAVNQQVLWLPYTYNSGLACARVDNAKIYHFAGVREKWFLTDRQKYYYKYTKEGYDL